MFFSITYFSFISQFILKVSLTELDTEKFSTTAAEFIIWI